MLNFTNSATEHMRSISELLRKPHPNPSPQEETLMIQPKREEPEDIYPDTMIGILERLKKEVLNPDAAQVKHQARLATERLTQIFSEDLIKTKEQELKKGKVWKGRLDLTANLGDQDGASWSGGEHLEIGDNDVVYSSRQSRSVGTFTTGIINNKTELRITSSTDFLRLFNASYTKTRNVNGDSQIVSSIKATFSNSSLVDFSFVDFKDGVRMEAKLQLSTS